MSDGVSGPKKSDFTWRIANILRGNIYHEAHTYILPLLVLKFASDSGTLTGASHFDHIYGSSHSARLGELIDSALRTLEQKVPFLSGVFRTFEFGTRDVVGQRELIELIGEIKNLDLSGSSSLGAESHVSIFEKVLSFLAAHVGRTGEELQTPPEVSSLLAQLIDASPGARVYDPFCRSGNLLAAVGKKLNLDCLLAGETAHQRLWTICKMNMYVNGLETARIECCNTLVSPAFAYDDQLEQFDVVISNPPFGLKWDPEVGINDRFGRFWRGIPPRGRADYAFISHMVRCAQEGSGQIVSLIPFGVLFRSGSEAEIRRSLVSENLVSAVIALPPHLFYSTSIPVAILVLNKGKSKDNILFIDATREFETEKLVNRLRPPEIKRILSVFENLEVVEGYSYLASATEVELNNFNLNVSRYVKTKSAQQSLGTYSLQSEIRALQSEIEDLESDLLSLHHELDLYLEELGITLTQTTKRSSKKA